MTRFWETYLVSSSLKKTTEGYARRVVHFVWFNLACSRLSDSGEDAKVKGTRKVGGARKRKRFFPLVLLFIYFFHVRAFSIQRTQLSPSLEQVRFNLIRISPVVTGYDLLRPYTGQFVSQFCGHPSCKPSNSPRNEASSQVATVSYSN